MARVYAWAAIVVWAVVASVFVLIGSATSAGAVVAVPFMLFAPGIVVALLFRFHSLALSATIVILTGIATGVLLPSLLLYTGAWSPGAAFAVVAGGTFATAAPRLFVERTPTASPRRGEAPLEGS